MEIPLIFAMYSLCALYAGLVALFTVGLFRKNRSHSRQTPSVSVVVAARNESPNIDACMAALAAQTYPTDRLEIILVDDQSTDDTARRMASWAERLGNVRWVRVETHRYTCRKKNALWHGIHAATGDIILTTDADCRPASGWITAMIGAFTPSVGMVIGPAPLAPAGGIRGALPALQSLVVMALAAGSAGVGFPLTCSGRNLAYRRCAFNDAGGFDGIGHIAGGDDVLLMRRIAQTHWRICFVPHAEARVPSQAHADHLLNRQVRYQSKAVHYAPSILLLALAVYIFHLILFLYPLFVWFYPCALSVVGKTLLIKIAADGVFLWSAARRLSFKIRLWTFALLEIAIIPYVVVICALGARTSFRWK